MTATGKVRVYLDGNAPPLPAPPADAVVLRKCVARRRFAPAAYDLAVSLARWLGDGRFWITKDEALRVAALNGPPAE